MCFGYCGKCHCEAPLQLRCEHLLSVLLSMYLRVKLLDNMVGLWVVRLFVCLFCGVDESQWLHYFAFSL